MHVGSSCAGRATMFRLQRGGRRPSRECRDVEGVEVPDVRNDTALRFHSTHPAAFPAIGGRMFFKPLRYLGAAPKALRRLPQGTKAQGPPAFWRQFFLVEPSGAQVATQSRAALLPSMKLHKHPTCG